MFTIKTMNAISPVGLAKLPKNLFEVDADTDTPDGILVRSADLLNTTFPENLLAIARAGAGVNNIPLDRCSEQGIVVFNTPGANANAVAELVMGMLIAGSRNVPAAAQWAQTLAGDPALSKSVEKGKKQFVGNEIQGKTLGVIGLGAIGSRVANRAIAMGMEVYGYDPYISIDAAWNLSSQVHHCVNLNDMLPLCDYLTIHVPYLPTTRGTINAQTLALCKDGVKVLNYARGELVNNEAILEALETGKVAAYMTDFPCEELLGKPGVLCTPHLGASTPEAEDNCAVMAAQELSDYLKNGNITHSVNLPEVNQPRAGGKRICIIHRNEPGMISQITTLTTEAGLNIENMVNKSKKEMAYTMLDVTGAVDQGLKDRLAAVPAVIRVRVL
ncbi:MAG TPA: phosphoglycerate dehydrogenase [Candidatus Faecalibacterium intestinipullorum]|uniref:D-3-phosphoglycerate dehydrogenase n=1 Tax=Faecalibacterium gallinarum TaxID=2903556 RepID=A0AA37MU97_9FIRM|nr:phosphoglycerate dehydrogenase [Faecalibacterium gallinarum]GJN63841.1 D-3-phosphoglycerate dehydrogenase [Faecalibacterium gallinarum]HIV50403.1 phosphoglycerate dehydrogenase [Candidatus Faecalibacterium intestinipullorum]